MEIIFFFWKLFLHSVPFWTWKCHKYATRYYNNNSCFSSVSIRTINSATLDPLTVTTAGSSLWGVLVWACTTGWAQLFVAKSLSSPQSWLPSKASTQKAHKYTLHVLADQFLSSSADIPAGICSTCGLMRMIEWNLPTSPVKGHPLHFSGRGAGFWRKIVRFLKKTWAISRRCL